jgi:hypothetical protein
MHKEDVPLYTNQWILLPLCIWIIGIYRYLFCIYCLTSSV